MTRINVEITVPEDEAETLAALETMTGDADFLSAAVLRVLRGMQTSYTVQQLDMNRMRALRQKAAPYAERAGAKSEADFLNGKA